MYPSKLKMISNATHDEFRPQNEFYTGGAQGFLGCFKNSDRYKLALQTELPKSIIKPVIEDPQCCLHAERDALSMPAYTVYE